MAAQTWSDILNLAMRDAGVSAQGQTPNAQMMNDAKLRCNMMLAQWMRRRWLSYHLVDTAHACTGAISYSVGLGGDFNIPRQNTIESVFIRQIYPSNTYPVDYPLEPIHSREDYNRIALKSLSASPPDSFFFDSGYPMGAIYPWPLPNANWELHISTKAPLASVASITDTILLPDEYQEALYSNSYMRFCSAFRLPQDKLIVAMAASSLRTLKAANTQIAELRMPAAIGGGGATYNIVSDR